MSAQKRQIDRPIEEIEAGEEFRSTLIPKADAMTPGEAPLWHGWAIMDAFLAGIDYARADAPASDLVKALEEEMAELLSDAGAFVERAIVLKKLAMVTDDANMMNYESHSDLMIALAGNHKERARNIESALTRHRQGEKA